MKEAVQDLRPPVQDLALLAALVSSMIAKACTLHASPVPRCARVLALPHCAAPQAADSYCTYGVVSDTLSCQELLVKGSRRVR